MGHLFEIPRKSFPKWKGGVAMKIRYFLFLFIPLLVLQIAGFSWEAWGGTKGKIAGYVRDKSTGEPLPGVNVYIEGTTMGAATDQNGYYYIVNVPPGVYKVVASMIGFKRTVMENVVVHVDVTTKVNFELEPTVLELAETVTVVAERPLIEPDVTTKTQTLTADEIRTMPVQNVRQIMTLQSGVVEMMGYYNMIAGFSTRGIEQVHVRGGRNGEIAYMIDGMYVEDAIYAGMGTLINREAIQELTVITGAFNAEYGEAQSSVVNIVTREGGSRYSGLLEYSSSEIAGKLGSKPDDLRNGHEAIFSFGGPVPLLKGLNFFVNASQSYRKFAVLEFDDIVYDPNNPDKVTWAYGAYRKAFEWDTIPGWRAFGFYYDWTFMGKLSWRITPTLKVTFWDRMSLRRQRDFNWAWQYAEEGRTVLTDRTDQQSFQLTHQISSSTFYEIRLGRFWKERTYRVHGINGHELTPGHGDWLRELWRRWSEIEGMTPPPPPPDLGPAEYPGHEWHGPFLAPLRFVRYDTLPDGRIRHVYAGSSDRYWNRNYQQNVELSAAITSQVTPHHQIKTGVSYKTFDLYFLEVQIPWLTRPYIEYYLNHPEEGAFYIQDKMEYGNLIVNAGIRFDYANSKGAMWDDPTDPSTPVTVGKRKLHWSPRLGIGHPITERAVFHFNYGHFYQVPEYRNLYINNARDLTTPRPLVGNPHLKAQKTIAYEAGIRQQIGNDWAVDVTVWSKESTNWSGTVNVTGFDPTGIGLYNYYIFLNHDYGSARGLDLTIEKRFSHYNHGQLNYTYSVSKANIYYSWAGYWQSRTPETEAKREYLTPWDQTHRLTINWSFIFPSNFGPKIWGFRPFGDLYVNFIIRANSGYPYTPTSGGQSLEPNTGRRPWIYTIDTMIRKDFRIAKNYRVSIFTRIFNLTDRKNPLAVYSETGSPTDPGPYASKTATSTVYDRPHHFGPRRMIDLGMQILF